jgi:hypothetical protein
MKALKFLVLARKNRFISYACSVITVVAAAADFVEIIKNTFSD